MTVLFPCDMSLNGIVNGKHLPLIAFIRNCITTYAGKTAINNTCVMDCKVYISLNISQHSLTRLVGSIMSLSFSFLYNGCFE